ncbi:hypothetical protein [Arenivirga flava]|uniref:hypothetical protein n=1 Tax=Arenivirga flava TaxID=1930060 RepID=UPI0024E08339|nr:hypothetical protein [Arenivirga flava]
MRTAQSFTCCPALFERGRADEQERQADDRDHRAGRPPAEEHARHGRAEGEHQQVQADVEHEPPERVDVVQHERGEHAGAHPPAARQLLDRSERGVERAVDERDAEEDDPGAEQELPAGHAEAEREGQRRVDGLDGDHAQVPEHGLTRPGELHPLGEAVVADRDAGRPREDERDRDRDQQRGARDDPRHEEVVPAVDEVQAHHAEHAGAADGPCAREGGGGHHATSFRSAPDVLRTTSSCRLTGRGRVRRGRPSRGPRR